MNAKAIKRQSRRRFLQVAGAATAALMIEGLPLTARAANADKIKIGIVGSGRVGGGIGSVWVKSGHEVMFSSRHIEHDKALAAKLGANAHAGTPREAVVFGKVVMISVPYGALPEVGNDLKALIKGKIVIDTCNPFVWRDGEIATWAREKGAGLASAELLPGARIVRAFNAIGAARMSTAHQDPGRIGMPIASDDAEAIAVVSNLIRDVGYEPVVIGDLEMGKYLMPGTPLAGEHTPEEIRKIAAMLDR
jgi:predicted dinucleotide-binding enzyme